MSLIVALIFGIIVVVVSLKFYESGSNCGNAGNDKQSGDTWFGSKSGDKHKCNGDCDNCPPHYGYRYGRWYYGHGHQRSCERGGNGGASGKTYRN